MGEKTTDTFQVTEIWDSRYALFAATCKQQIENIRKNIRYSISGGTFDGCYIVYYDCFSIEEMLVREAIRYAWKQSMAVD